MPEMNTREGDERARQTGQAVRCAVWYSIEDDDRETGVQEGGRAGNDYQNDR
jgi:hypothetical protein